MGWGLDRGEGVGSKRAARGGEYEGRKRTYPNPHDLFFSNPASSFPALILV